MKKLTILFSLALLLLAISSCEKKSCTNVVCASYQTCIAGQCLCQNGYEGDTCSVLSSTKYVGSWTLTENCPNGPSGLPTYYSVNISLNPQYAVNYIAITPLLEAGTFYAQIQNLGPANEGLTINIPPQTVNGISVTAGSSGTYYPPNPNGGTAEILLTLNYIYQGDSYQCIETLHKN